MKKESNHFGSAFEDKVYIDIYLIYLKFLLFVYKNNMNFVFLKIMK